MFSTESGLQLRRAAATVFRCNQDVTRDNFELGSGQRRENFLWYALGVTVEATRSRSVGIPNRDSALLPVTVQVRRLIIL